MKIVLLLTLLVAAAVANVEDGWKNSFSSDPVDESLNVKEILSKILKSDGRVSINDQADILFAELRKFVAEQKIDPVRLPSDSDTFTVTLFNQTMDGMFEISNIRIGGFSAIHRTGECSVNIGLQGTDVVIDFGSNDILLGVDVSFGAGILRANIGLELVVSHVSLMVSVRVIGTGTEIRLRDFKLNEIGRVAFDIKGIPMGSKSISNLLNVVSNSVKDTLLYAFQEALRPLIESIITGPGAVSFMTEYLANL